MLAHELRNPLAPIRNVAYVLCQGRRGPGDGAPLGPDDRTAGESSHASRRRSARCGAHHARPGGTATRAAEPRHRGGCRAGDGAAGARTRGASRCRCASLARSVFVEGDSVRLCQVVANLLTNASKYSPERARIEIVIDGSAVDAIVEVRDPGVGIDAQLLPHLFDLFLQGDRTLDRSQGGLGVGLTIVKLLVEMHGGSVEAHSAGLGKGSEFRIRLPRALRRPANSLRQRSPERKAAGAPASRPGHRRQCRCGRIHARAAAHRRPRRRGGV